MICGQKTCECLAHEHKNCDFTLIDTLIEKIAKKKGQLNQETAEVFNFVDKILLDSIQWLSEKRQGLLLWKENYGLNFNEIKLIDQIKTNSFNNLNGKFISEIKKNLHESKQELEAEPSSVSLDEMQRIWVKQRVNFEKNFENIFENIHVYNETSGTKKLNYSINLESKTGKEITFDTKNQIYERTGNNLGVLQVSSIQPLPKKGKYYFETEMIETKGGYFATGVVTKNIKD